MKRFFTLLIACVALSMTANAQLKFVDATELGIHGHTKKTDKSPYYRFDHTPYEGFNETVIDHAKKCVGLYITFKTNSSQIAVTWENAPASTLDNMTGILQLGLDLYIKSEGEWKFASVGRVYRVENPDRRTRTLIENLPKGENEFILYLPIWCEMREVLIGVDKDAYIEGMATPFRHKVIVHGSSLTHGASASRAGLTYPAILSRNLGIDFVNFGFSGECKMQPQFLEFLKSCQTDAFLFDTFSNSSTKEIEERLEGFVAELVKAHPNKPIIFLQSPIIDEYRLNTKKLDNRQEKKEVVVRMMKAIEKQYKDVYFLNVDNVLGKDGTIDNSHPTDLGFYRFVQAYQPKIAKILKKYGIK